DGAVRTVGGVVTALSRKWTKKGDLMAVFTLEDLQGSAEVMVFPKTMQQVGHLLADDRVVVVTGRIDKRDDLPQLRAIEISAFDGVVDGAPPLRVQLGAGALSDTVLERLRELVEDHPGDSQVFLHLERQVLRLPHTVDLANGLVAELRVLLGPDAVIL
ncbi:MAG TPA: OB-fold nucleic acid binding domain-containing protein, partial [Acidimicrobiales bacterium]|nr:OB-fold nucleic acid binding domain-containing protein [Acidimicrobiales bacterium]